jgi:hypothetical protein
VQLSPSLQLVPSVFAGLLQTPVDVLHVPATWHWSCAVQVTGFAPVQVPDWQVSVCVQGFASLQVLPFALDGLLQVPVSALHAPVSWHWSDAEQPIGVPPTHCWLWQVEVPLQAVASSHAVPLAFPVHWPQGILIFAVRQPPGRKQCPALPL